MDSLSFLPFPLSPVQRCTIYDKVIAMRTKASMQKVTEREDD